MSLYPSLEDLKVDRAIQAQAHAQALATTGQILASTAQINQTPAIMGAPEAIGAPGLYPNLAELCNYMGLSLSSEEVQMNLALVPAGDNVNVFGVLSGSGLFGEPLSPERETVATRPSAQGMMVAPVTGNNIGLCRAEIKQGLREVILCKDENGKMGLRLASIDKGIFVQLVQANSPASLVGLRFGDQILQIDGQDCAGWSSDKAHKALKKASQDRISMIARDRPFQRTITMHKDSTGHVGFIYKKGKITSIVKDGSAARNGLLTNHYLCEINGQNVIGLKDSQVGDILATAGNVITITIIPSVIYEHMVKKMSSSLIKSSMDHSIPEV